MIPLWYHSLPLFILHLVVQVSSLASNYSYPYNYYHCDDPGAPDNGYLTSGNDIFSVGTTVLYVCDTGYILYGSKNITCEHGLYEAYWTDDAPTCIRKSLIIIDLLYSIHFLIAFISDGEVTPGQRCGRAPKSGPYAETVSSNSTVIEYDCRKKDDYIVVSGDRVLYCYKKTWYGEPLECRR